MHTSLYNRVHGNTGSTPHNRIDVSQVQHIIQSLTKYSETHGILLPGRIPGYKSDEIHLLPSSTTKRAVWETYNEEAQNIGLRTVSRTYFQQLWKQLLPHLMVCKPMSDLCWVCQQNSTAIIRAANRPDSEKSQVST